MHSENNMALQLTVSPFSGEGKDADDSFASVQLSGRITLGPQLLHCSQRIAGLLTARRVRGIMIEMSAVDVIDSAGLGELVVLYTRAGEQGRRLCLLSPAPHLVRLLETTRLSGILRHFAALEDATTWLSNQGREQK